MDGPGYFPVLKQLGYILIERLPGNNLAVTTPGYFSLKDYKRL